MTRQLHTGRAIPLVGFGTYLIDASSIGAVNTALDSGYPMLDCAGFYGNEDLIGQRVMKGRARDSLYIISKVWNDAVYGGRDSVRAAVLESIQNLQCEFLDLCLVHWPVPGRHIDAYKELLVLQSQGLIRDVGVSNYTIEDYEELIAVVGERNRPSVNQIEINPFLNRAQTIKFFQSRGVHLMAYRGLRNASALEHPTVVAVAGELGLSAGQILGRWLVQQGISHIPKSTNSERIRNNADLFSFNLSEGQMDRLGKLTTLTSLEGFRDKYIQRVVSDTPLASVGRKITVD